MYILARVSDVPDGLTIRQLLYAKYRDIDLNGNLVMINAVTGTIAVLPTPL